MRKKARSWCARIYRGVLLLSFTLPLFAHADTPDCPPGSLRLCNHIKYNNLMDFLLEILTIVVRYGVLLIVFFLVFAGFKFVTAQGNTEKISEAKKQLVWIVVGAFVLLGVYVIRAAICGTIGQLGVTVQCGT